MITLYVIFILIILVILASILYHIKYKMNIYIRRNNDVIYRRKILIELYNIFIDVAEKTNTKPFIIYGTLLGYIRNKDLICYDYDLDFGIDSGEYDTFKNYFLEFIKKFDDYYVDIKDFLNYKNFEVIHKKSRLSADIFSFTLSKNYYSRDVLKLYSKYYLNETCIDFPKDWISPLKPISFLNRKTFLPNKAEELLKCYYGKNYIIPDHECNKECKICKKR
jgi:phosphorylcholine metabolism protein LicD